MTSSRFAIREGVLPTSVADAVATAATIRSREITTNGRTTLGLASAAQSDSISVIESSTVTRICSGRLGVAIP